MDDEMCHHESSEVGQLRDAESAGRKFDPARPTTFRRFTNHDQSPLRRNPSGIRVTGLLHQRVCWLG
jgi:hypothetical protein